VLDAERTATHELHEAEPREPFPADFDPFDNFDFGVQHRWEWAYGRRIAKEKP
jgi:hypothetical protein